MENQSGNPTEETTFTFVDEVISELEEKMRQMPYQINLLEEVHLHDAEEKGRGKKNVGENAHTRILRKILMFRTQTDYPLLQDLIQYVKEESHATSWDTINIKDPVFLPEKNCNLTSGRIDLLIEESGRYAIIFENKINDATDQTSQLGRYIEHLMESGYQEDQIFVLYLSAEGKEPNNDSWKLNKLDYQERFSPRYFNLSYKYSVLPWIEKRVGGILSTMSGQKILKEAVSQYVDYLRGKFSLRPEENEKLDEVLREKLVKTSLSLNQQMKVLDDKLDQLKRLRKKIDTEQETANNERLKKMKHIDNRIRAIKFSLLASKIQKGQVEFYDRRYVYERECYVGVKFDMNDRQYILYIGLYNYFFCSIISYPRKGEAIDAQTRRCLESYFSKKQSSDWMGMKYETGDYESALNKMNQVLGALRCCNE